MPNADFQTAVRVVFANEGGFSNAAGDRGLATNWGISTPTYQAWLKAHGVASVVTPTDMKAMPQTTASLIYQTLYWAPMKCDAVQSQAVATALLDAAVLCGTRKAAMLAQAACGAKQDGSIGPITLAAINGMTPFSFLQAFTQAETAFLCDIVRADASQLKFLSGWLTRCAKLMLLAFT